MMKYKVFAQSLNHSFVEIAETRIEEDANIILHRYDAGMVTEDNRIIATKNLKPDDSPALF